MPDTVAAHFQRGRLMPCTRMYSIPRYYMTGLEILSLAHSENLSTRLVFFTGSVEERE